MQSFTFSTIDRGARAVAGEPDGVGLGRSRRTVSLLGALVIVICAGALLQLMPLFADQGGVAQAAERMVVLEHWTNFR